MTKVNSTAWMTLQQSIAIHPCLQIYNEKIIWCIQHCLQDSATNMEYQNYLQEKFQWMPQISTTVDWQTHALAQHWLKQAEKQIISKFIHKWLPLQDQYHVHSTSVNNICPSCWQSTETVEHFLQCPHTDWQAIWRTMHDSIYKVHLQQQVPPQCYNALAPNKAMVTAQAKLGCTQLYYGWFSAIWVQVLNYIQTTIKGISFYSKVITLIWTAILFQWNQQNCHFHPPNPTQDDRTQLCNLVYQILMEAQSDPLLQDLVSSFNPEVLLTQHTKYICKWITNSRDHIQAQCKAATLQAQLKH